MKFDRIHANHSWLACSAIIGSSGFGYWTSRVTRSHSSKGNRPKVLGVPCVKITFATSSQASPMLADARVIPRRADFEGEAPNEPASQKVVALVPNTLSCRTPSAQSAKSELLFGLRTPISSSKRVGSRCRYLDRSRPSLQTLLEVAQCEITT